MGRITSPPPNQTLAERAQHLLAVKNSPSWPVVKQMLQEKIDAKTSVVLASHSLSDSQLHYGRGYAQGMRVMLLMIEDGEKAYEAAIRAARTIQEAQEGVS